MKTDFFTINFPKSSNRLQANENLFARSTLLSAILIIVIILAIFFTLVVSSMPAIKALGFKFFHSSQWDPVSGEYGAVPFLFGTLITSLLALLISMPFSLAFGILLGEYYPKGVFNNVFKNI